MVMIAICGPPGSGKTTAAKEMHKSGTDILIDFDDIYADLTGMPYQEHGEMHLKAYTVKAKQSLVTLAYEFRDQFNIYVLYSEYGATMHERKDLHRRGFKQVITMRDADLDTCMERIKGRHHEDELKLSIIEWFSRFGAEE